MDSTDSYSLGSLAVGIAHHNIVVDSLHNFQLVGSPHNLGMLVESVGEEEEVGYLSWL